MRSPSPLLAAVFAATLVAALAAAGPGRGPVSREGVAAARAAADPAPWTLHRAAPVLAQESPDIRALRDAARQLASR